MRVDVRFYGVAMDAAGRRDETVELPEDSTVRDLADKLIEFHGAQFKGYVYEGGGKPRDYLMWSVNEVDIMGLNGFDTALSDGDRVFVMPPIGGG
ncbi:MoaD/ThiS family protein [Candidatus Bathyarchaeota archaeon]|nr:MoaD/ThiS family protein [Candidatus Bathyarchaeota archaeon]